ncbi:hypothetical protein EV175_002992 [Coemansia sp. RSA 1933]|nr:hypothetical protein EV175_002992 [Coemansia sp. RSA 1933]
MSNLHPFQRLPEAIADAIAHYLCDSSNRHSMFFRPKKGLEDPWFVLHDVSLLWRLIALKTINKEARLTLVSDAQRPSLMFTPGLHQIDGTVKHLPYVKKVDIMFGDVFNQSDPKKMDALFSCWPAEYVFPWAQTLLLNVDYDNDPGKASHDSAANDRHYQWLAQRIKTSFPKLQKFEVFSKYEDFLTIGLESIHSAEWNSSLFLPAFHREARNKIFPAPSSTLKANRDLIKQNAPLFTSIIHFGECIDPEVAQHFIRKSAATLESLELSNRTFKFVEGCLYGNNGKALTYPRLKKLNISASLENREKPIKVKDNKLATLFPALQVLKLYPGRIFSNYLLFQASIKTLISLDIELDSESIALLQKDNVFSNGADSQLCHVKVRLNRNTQLHMGPDDFIKFVFGLCAPATKSLSIIATLPVASVMTIIPTYPDVNTLQILDLQESPLSLLETLTTIQSFPAMSDFSSYFAGVDLVLGTFPGLSLLEYLRRRCKILSQRFRCWHVYPDMRVPADAIAISAITLALVCPRFTCAHVQGGDIGQIFRDLNSGIEVGKYREHAETVKRVFYI